MNVLLGITGSIAAYKAPDLVRRLREEGMDVRVVMTQSGKAFITPLTLQAVSGNPVRDDLLDPAHEAGMGHIELSRWADVILIAPCSANMISKLTVGLADDLLTTLCLASPSPIILAPGMNRLMWDNAIIQSNMQLLKNRGVTILEPNIGHQACGEMGKGRMLEPLEIRSALVDFLNKRAIQAPNQNILILKGKTVVITAGPTIEPIDPVRFLSNHSSGKMAYALAKACVDAGAKVILVSGPVSLLPPVGVELIAIQTAQELLKAVLKVINKADIFIAAAAVADYHVAEQSAHKIKKKVGDEFLTLTLKKTPDILHEVSKLANRPFCVGFAAETTNVLEHAEQKLKSKNLDLICANDVSNGKVFGQDTNQLTIINRKGDQYIIGQNSKENIAKELVSYIVTESLK